MKKIKQSYHRRIYSQHISQYTVFFIASCFKNANQIEDWKQSGTWLSEVTTPNQVGYLVQNEYVFVDIKKRYLRESSITNAMFKDRMLRPLLT